MKLAFSAFLLVFAASPAGAVLEFGDHPLLHSLLASDDEKNGVSSPLSSNAAVVNDATNDDARHLRRGSKGTGGTGKSGNCDPSRVELADFPQWRGELGYWVGEYSFYGSDGKEYVNPNWPYHYDSYMGFITGNIECNKYRQRNLFLYPALVSSDPGSSRIFEADQQATTSCDGSIEGIFSSFGIPFETETTLVGRDNAVLYQVYQPNFNGTVPFPYTCNKSIFQSQLTTLNVLPDGTEQRTRTAQGFEPDCTYVAKGDRGKQAYSSFYRETKVSKDEFYAALNATIAAYDVPEANLGAFLGSGIPSGMSGYAFVESHLESSFALECDEIVDSMGSGKSSKSKSKGN